MNLHEASIIFRLGYKYTQVDVDRAYGELCSKVDPGWGAELAAGKQALEDALRSRSVSSAVVATAVIPQIHDSYTPPSTPSYNEVTPFIVPLLPAGTPLETFPFRLSPLLGVLGTSSVKNPRLIPPRVIGNLTIVLDLDETLLYARGPEPIAVRPYTRVLLKALKEIKDYAGKQAIEIILFSAGDRRHVDIGRALLDPLGNIFTHSICRGSWLQSEPALKDLSQFSADFADPLSPTGFSLNWGGRKGSCMLFDDSRYAAVKSGDATVVLPPFNPQTTFALNDTTLLYVLQLAGRMSHIFSFNAYHKMLVCTESGVGSEYKRDVGELVALDLVVDHPFTRVLQLATCWGTPVTCLCLDALDPLAVAARIKQFAVIRDEIMIKHNKVIADSATTAPGSAGEVVSAPATVDMSLIPSEDVSCGGGAAVDDSATTSPDTAGVVTSAPTTVDVSIPSKDPSSGGGAAVILSSEKVHSPVARYSVGFFAVTKSHATAAPRPIPDPITVRWGSLAA